MKTGIPKSFKLLGHNITVRVIPRSRWDTRRLQFGIAIRYALRSRALAQVAVHPVGGLQGPQIRCGLWDYG